MSNTPRINVRNIATSTQLRVHEAAHAAVDAITNNLHAAVSSTDAPGVKVETVLRLHAMQTAIMRAAQRHTRELEDAACDDSIM